MSISIVVPVYNEEDCLKECFLQITETFKNSDYELIFVNDGSTDNSHQIILELIEKNQKIKYAFYEKNKGYSGAIREGFKMSENDFVSFLDADLQYPPQDLFKMYGYAKENNLDFVMGSPIKKIKYNSPLRKIMSFIYNAYISLLFDIKVKDHNSLKLMRRKYLEKINFRYGYGMIEIETLLGFKMQGVPVITYPINVQKRIAGKSKCSLKITYRTVIDCLKLRFSKNKLIKNG
ncbi:MAG: glycosyltransferase family 2 protein [Patescibacteria group bacterium]